jgi:group I intron endonuclease
MIVEKKVGIYKITSPNNKIYIGQSRNIDLRKNQYSRLQCKNQKKLYSSILKYGWDNFCFDILAVFPCSISQDELNRYEIFYWEEYKNQGFKMLNIKTPGSNGKLSEETKIKISKANKGMKMPIEACIKISNARKGIKFSDEHKLKLRLSKLGTSRTIESKFKISKNSKKSKIVLDISTGVFFLSAKEASIAYSKNHSTLISMLCGDAKNKTNLIYA